MVKSEYQPAVPNDYVVQKRKKEEREAREKIAREIADRLEIIQNYLQPGAKRRRDMRNSVG